MGKTTGFMDYPRELAPRRPGDMASVIANTAKLSQILNWKPRYADLETIVSTALVWERRIKGEMDASVS